MINQHKGGDSWKDLWWGFNVMMLLWQETLVDLDMLDMLGCVNGIEMNRMESYSAFFWGDKTAT